MRRRKRGKGTTRTATGEAVRQLIDEQPLHPDSAKLKELNDWHAANPTGTLTVVVPDAPVLVYRGREGVVRERALWWVAMSVAETLGTLPDPPEPCVGTVEGRLVSALCSIEVGGMNKLGGMDALRWIDTVPWFGKLLSSEDVRALTADASDEARAKLAAHELASAELEVLARVELAAYHPHRHGVIAIAMKLSGVQGRRHGDAHFDLELREWKKAWFAVRGVGKRQRDGSLAGVVQGQAEVWNRLLTPPAPRR